MRHGEAVQDSEPDHARALTNFGKAQCEHVGKWLDENLSNFEHQSATSSAKISLALVSPYLRAQQTCRAVNKSIHIAQQITIDAVTPLASANQAADLIHGYASDSHAPKSMLVVTHMPLVSLLADKVCSGFNAQYFDTADTLIIDYDEHTGVGSQLAFYQGIDEQKEAN